MTDHHTTRVVLRTHRRSFSCRPYHLHHTHIRYRLHRTHISLTCIIYYTTQNNMDFSQFNGAEQAHMSKVIEKKQVRPICFIPFSQH